MNFLPSRNFLLSHIYVPKMPVLQRERQQLQTQIFYPQKCMAELRTARFKTRIFTERGVLLVLKTQRKSPIFPFRTDRKKKDMLRLDVFRLLENLNVVSSASRKSP